MTNDVSQSVVAELVIMGKMAGGKTTSQDYLVQKYGAQPWTVSERIKQVSYALVDGVGNLDQLLSNVLLDEHLRARAAYQLLRYADSYEREPGKPRKLLQDVGQILRDLDPASIFCWEEDLERRIQASPASFPVVDLRSKESYAFFVGERRYHSLLVFADEEVRKRRMLARDKFAVVDPSVFQHQSETDVDDLEFEFQIENNYDDPARLYQELDRVVAAIRQV